MSDLQSNQVIQASDLDLLPKPLGLRRTPTRLSSEYGKYTFSINFLDNNRNLCYIDNIIIQDMGQDLYETDKGRKKIMNEILSNMKFADDVTIKL